jgi:glutamyl-tRNA synthetase
MSEVRVRFCPSPTGDPHVGMVRTALFNWAYARHTGGKFVFRIEDTDTARDSEDSYQMLLDSLRWLGLNWDEGPEVGGPFGPYRQSERFDIYRDVAARLLNAGHAYHCFCSPEELEARRDEAKQQNRTPGYDGKCRNLTEVQRAEYKAAGREPVLRFKMPGTDFTWNDLVRGELTFAAEHVPDYVLVRGSGDPLYTLVNPVDDALMEITHVLRGEDLLSSTPRQIALYAALKDIGVGNGTTPEFGHLPYVMGEGNKKLSKRDPESSLSMYRNQGFLPEGLLNYLALLGWSMGDDQEFFNLEQMAAAFEISRVNPNPARFDLKKCTAINADWIRSLAPAELINRLMPYLQTAAVLPEKPSSEQLELLSEAIELVQERIETLSQGVEMLRFLFVPESGFVLDPHDKIAVLDENGLETLAAAQTALVDVSNWNRVEIEAALRAKLIEQLGLKPKSAFGPVRVAVTGKRVSPPLFESLELLGKDRSMQRISSALSS